MSNIAKKSSSSYTKFGNVARYPFSKYKVIAVDEIGGRKDYDALLKCENSGCNLIATVHGDDIEDVKKRNNIMKDILENNIFERFIVLNNKKLIVEDLIINRIK